MQNDRTEQGAGAPGASGQGDGARASRVKLSAASLASWIEAAQPGAQLCYFSGHFAGDGSVALNERLRAEAGRGMVFLVQRKRPPIGADYLVIRSSRPHDADRAPRRPHTLAGQAAEMFRTRPA